MQVAAWPKKFMLKGQEEVFVNLIIHPPATAAELFSVFDSEQEKLLHRNQEVLENFQISKVRKFPVRLLIDCCVFFVGNYAARPLSALELFVYEGRYIHM